MITAIDTGVKATTMIKNVVDLGAFFSKSSVSVSDVNVAMLVDDVENILTVLQKYKAVQREYSTSNVTLNKISKLYANLAQVKNVDNEQAFLVLLLMRVTESGYTTVSTNNLVRVPKAAKELDSFTDVCVFKDKNILRRSFSHMLEILKNFEIYETRNQTASEIVKEFKSNKDSLILKIQNLYAKSKLEEEQEKAAAKGVETNDAKPRSISAGHNGDTKNSEIETAAAKSSETATAKSSETATAKSSETAAAKSSETVPAKSSETATAKSSETATAKSSETATAKSSETVPAKSSETATAKSSETATAKSSETAADTDGECDESFDEASTKSPYDSDNAQQEEEGTWKTAHSS
jgi:hypothetical protein